LLSRGLPMSCIERVKAAMHDFRKEDRGIIFCNSIPDAQIMSQRTGFLLFIGPLDPRVKPVIAQAWCQGTHKWLVATSAFSEGVDYLQVRFVLNVEAPHGMMEYDQMAGRAGRDGEPAMELLMYSALPVPFDGEGVDHKGCDAMRRYVVLSEQCRRIEIGRHNDDQDYRCVGLANSQLCDNCITLVVCISSFVFWKTGFLTL
jgi:superfamily II DNA helicase RecQ